MARYDYKCPKCDIVFEIEHPMGEHPEVRCPECGGIANQVFGASGIVFKGSGFYNTDQRPGSHKASTAAPTAKKESASSESKGSSDSSSSTSSDSSSTSSSSSSSSTSTTSSDAK